MKLRPKFTFKDYMTMPKIGFSLMGTGVVVGLLGVAIGGQVGYALVIFGIALAALGGVIAAPPIM